MKPEHHPVAQMSETEKAKAREIGERINRATLYLDRNGQPWSSRSEDANGGDPQRQNQVNQDKQAPALTPTDSDAGKTALERANTPSKGAPAKAPDKSASHTGPQKPPQHDRGAWER